MTKNGGVPPIKNNLLHSPASTKEFVCLEGECAGAGAAGAWPADAAWCFTAIAWRSAGGVLELNDGKGTVL